MSFRGEQIATGEYYHIYNRGVDKRNIFEDINDLNRFIQSMKEFNTINPIGSIKESLILKKIGKLKNKNLKTKLVEFVAFNLLPNHFHFILEQKTEGGLSEFMKRMGGYTKYFNERHNRSGSLFQGKYKFKHIGSDDYLLHVSAYVNLNHRVHKFGQKISKKLFKSSWDEYIGRSNTNFCNKDIILGQSGNIDEYKKFAEESIKGTILNRREDINDSILNNLW